MSAIDTAKPAPTVDPIAGQIDAIIVALDDHMPDLMCGQRAAAQLLYDMDNHIPADARDLAELASWCLSRAIDAAQAIDEAWQAYGRTPVHRPKARGQNDIAESDPAP